MLLNSRGTPRKPGCRRKPVKPVDFYPKSPNSDRFTKGAHNRYQRLQSGATGPDGVPAPGKAGYLYILSNPSLGNIIKIGKTTRDPARDRISELSAATSIPTPFVWHSMPMSRTVTERKRSSTAA